MGANFIVGMINNNIISENIVVVRQLFAVNLIGTAMKIQFTISNGSKNHFKSLANLYQLPLPIPIISTNY